MTEPGTARVIVAMVFAVIALSFSAIFIKQLDLIGVPPLIIALYRMTLATLILLPATLALKRREIRMLERKDILMLALGGFFLALHFGAWIASLKYLPIATAVVLVNSHPLFVVLASYFFLGEKPSRRSLTGTGIGLAGMLIISSPGLKNVETGMVGNTLAILGALAVVGYFIIGRSLRARLSLLAYVTPLYAVCCLFLLVWAMLAGNAFHPYGATEWGYLAALAVVPTIFGHTVFNWAIKHVKPTAISLAFLGEPVFAALLAFIFFSQQPPAATFIGGALVLAGIYLTTSTRRASSDAKSESGII